MAVPAWLTATWGELLSSDPDPTTGEAQTGEQKRRVFEANIAKAVCEGLSLAELNALVSQIQALPLNGDLFWWLHQYSADEYEGLRQLGGCPSEQYTPPAIVDQQISIALEEERAKQRRWTIGLGVGAVLLVGAAAWALWPRRLGYRRRRR